MTWHRARFVASALFLFAAACSGTGSQVDALAEGESAPSFTLPSASGEKVELAEFAGEKPALLYFSMGPG